MYIHIYIYYNNRFWNICKQYTHNQRLSNLGEAVGRPWLELLDLPLNIFIKSEVWPIYDCLRLGHETMLCAGMSFDSYQLQGFADDRLFATGNVTDIVKGYMFPTYMCVCVCVYKLIMHVWINQKKWYSNTWICKWVKNKCVSVWKINAYNYEWIHQIYFSDLQ